VLGSNRRCINHTTKPIKAVINAPATLSEKDTTPDPIYISPEKQLIQHIIRDAEPVLTGPPARNTPTTAGCGEDAKRQQWLLTDIRVNSATAVWPEPNPTKWAAC
jgi:hypothetical protein